MRHNDVQAALLLIPGVTYVGPRHQPVLGVQTEAVRALLAPLCPPGIDVVVMPVRVTKHRGVQTYEDVMRETEPC